MSILTYSNLATAILPLSSEAIGGIIPDAFSWDASASRVAIAFYGDSISVGAWAGTTNASWDANGFVGLLRTALQAEHGNGGQGFVDMGRYEWVKTGTWTQLADYGPFGQAWYATSDPTKYWTLTVADGDNIDIFYSRGGSYGAFDVVVDGTTTTTITPTGTADASMQKANVSLGSAGAHTVVIKAPASGTLYLCGAAIYKGTTGLVVHNISRSGSVVNDMAFNIAKRLSAVAYLDPSLNIIGYVANDFSVQTAVATYKTRLNTLATTLAAYGEVMFWMPPDNGLTGKAIPVENYEKVVREVANDRGAYWLDVHAAWGDYTANIPKMNDTVHPNTTGHAAMKDLFLPALELVGA